MTTDALLRIVAVVAAVAILAAPHWRLVARAVEAAVERAKAHGSTIGRLAAAGLIVAAAWGTFPVPTLPVPAVPSVVVAAPSEELQRLVEPVRVALGTLSPADRALWAATWAKLALVAEAEGGTSVEVIRTTPEMRAWTAAALDVAWRRIGGHAPGSVEGLREAVEAAMRSALGLEEVPVTSHVRSRYAEVARAIGWAGTR